ncbi:FaeA/PapI family transcriptional regulator [Enterobacter asburiae]|uniref:FaeA/PapI family transcriptional regulator n=1 Tax=Enterobacter asburiae TaxID=61645 RepID=UPI0013B47450|nr:FaeA/PapI family transcriptional regulator [Enterobacter asburiae]
MSTYISSFDRKKNTFLSTPLLQGKMNQVMMAVYQAGENGLTTREVADICDLSVYAARNWLMKLEAENHIQKMTKPRNTTWHVT